MQLSLLLLSKQPFNYRMDFSRYKRMHFPKVSSIVGSFLMLLPGRPILYWGNLSVYVLSNIIICHNPDIGIQPVWLSTMYSLCWSTGMVVNGFVSNIIGKRVVIAIGMVIFNLCIFFSYFLIRDSTTTFIMVYGSLTGLGNGIGEGLLFKHYVVPWSTTDTGCLTSIVISAAEFGAVIMDQFVTLYVNPDNLSSDTTRGKLKLFSQESILDRVPSLFIIQGVASSVIQLIGFGLIRTNETLKTDSADPSGLGEVMPGTSRALEESGTNSMLEIPNKTHSSNGNGIQGLDSMTPLAMLKSPMFYFLWVAYFSSTTSRTVLNTYYKIYGQNHIHDDYFLTNLGTMMTTLAAVITLMWGVLMDKVRLKTVHITIQTILSLANIFLYFAPKLNGWVYFINCCLLTSATAPLYMCFTVSIILLFGRDQLNVKMAIASTAPLASSLVAAPVAEVILPNLGWFALFMWPGILAVSSLILIVCVFPEI